MASSKITKAKANSALRAVIKQYSDYPTSDVVLIDRGDMWEIVWEGGPEEWIYTLRINVPGVFAEPINSVCLGLYPA